MRVISLLLAKILVKQAVATDWTMFDRERDWLAVPIHAWLGLAPFEWHVSCPAVVESDLEGFP